jgi:hypothetical protein
MGWIITVLIIVILGAGSVSPEDTDHPFLVKTMGFFALVILVIIIISSC